MEAESSGGATSEREREKETKGHCRGGINSYEDRGKNRLASRDEVDTNDSVVPDNRRAIDFREKDLGDVPSSKGADIKMNAAGFKVAVNRVVVSLDNSDDDGAGSSASDATTIVKANSRGDAQQQQQVVENKTTSAFKTDSGETASSSPEKNQRSNSDDEISRLRLDKNGIQLRKTLQSEINVVKGDFLV